MTIQQAIQRARDNGYVPVDSWGERIDPGEMLYEQAFVDPLFWQSLGKAIGWPEDTTYCDHCGEADIAGEYITYDEEHSDCSNLLTFPKYWRYQWHSFIDHLAKGETAESFFETL